MTTKELINELFNKLDEWRQLSAYQLERRSDIFFALYLPIILKARFNQNIDLILPEFPVRIGNLYSDKQLDNPNLSFKIDYVAICNTSNKVFLIELKTDDNSRRNKQDWYLEMAKSNNVIDLVNGVLQIYKATSSKKKYYILLTLLTTVG